MLQSGSPFTILDTSADSNADSYYNDRGDYIGSGSPVSTVTHIICPADGYITKTAMFIAIRQTRQIQSIHTAIIRWLP